jgi:predicted dehydrogenase
MSKNMKVLFIGLGGIGQRHLRLLKNILPNAAISAVRHSTQVSEITDTLQLNSDVDIEQKYNIKIYHSIEEAMMAKPDFAIVANPTSMHVETAIKLVGNKIPVLLEKPISNSDSRVDDLVALSLKNNTPVMIAFMMRFHPCAIQLEKYITDQVLGNIYNISINVNSYMPSWHKYESYNSFYAGRNDLGGGVILTEIHEIDLLNSFFGMPEKLYAIGGKRSALDLDVEDSVSVLMGYKQNDSEFAVTLNMSFVQRAPIREFYIFGEHGSILWNISDSTIVLNDYTNGFTDTHSFDEFQRNDMFRDQMVHFIDSVESKTIPLTNLSNVIGGHKIALNIKKAIADNNS